MSEEGAGKRKKRWKDKIKLFWSVFPPKYCPFRYASEGRTYCKIASDPHFAEVDPLICSNCDVYQSLLKVNCKYLSAGVDVKNYRGEGKVSVTFACGKKVWRIYDLRECEGCEDREEGVWGRETEAAAKTITPASQHPVLVMEGPHLRQVIKEVLNSHFATRREVGVDEVYCPFLRRKGCLKPIVYEPKGVFLVYPLTDRYLSLYAEVEKHLKRLELFSISFRDLPDKTYCGVCEAVLSCGRVVVDVSLFSEIAATAIAIAGGSGRRVVLLRERTDAELPETIFTLKVAEYGVDDHWETLVRELGL